MKKNISILLTAGLLCCATACGGTESVGSSEAGSSTQETAELSAETTTALAETEKAEAETSAAESRKPETTPVEVIDNVFELNEFNKQREQYIGKRVTVKGYTRGNFSKNGYGFKENKDCYVLYMEGVQDIVDGQNKASHVYCLFESNDQDIREAGSNDSPYAITISGVLSIESTIGTSKTCCLDDCEILDATYRKETTTQIVAESKATFSYNHSEFIEKMQVLLDENSYSVWKIAGYDIMPQFIETNQGSDYIAYTYKYFISQEYPNFYYQLVLAEDKTSGKLKGIIVSCEMNILNTDDTTPFLNQIFVPLGVISNCKNSDDVGKQWGNLKSTARHDPEAGVWEYKTLNSTYAYECTLFAGNEGTILTISPA